MEVLEIYAGDSGAVLQTKRPLRAPKIYGNERHQPVSDPPDPIMQPIPHK
jgi:hypothetical protein